MREGLRIGHYDYLVARREAIGAANPQLRKKLGCEPVQAEPPPPTRQAPPERRDFPVGSYITPALKEIMLVAAKAGGMDIAEVLGTRRHPTLANIRSAIASLAIEFAPDASARMVARAMQKTESICHYYRINHADRLAAYPKYSYLHGKCRAVLAAKQAAGGTV
jgi:hypothetical protein